MYLAAQERDDDIHETVSEPELGVIEEARRRRRRRRGATAVAIVVAAVVAGVAWGAGRTSHAGPRAGGGARHSAGRSPRGDAATTFKVRVWPYLAVGQAGWCMVVEEHGRAGGSTCGGLATLGAPFVLADGWGEATAPTETQVAITLPQVAAVLVAGHQRVPTIPLPGVPYGLRAVRVLAPRGASVQALDAQDHRLAQDRPTQQSRPDVTHWHYPSSAPRGFCGLSLRLNGMPSSFATGGAVATRLAPVPAVAVGQAFYSCSVSAYRLRNIPLKAFVVVDLVSPHAQHPAPMPGFKPVRGAPGLYSQGGTLTAKRSGPAWIIVEQGSDQAERILLLGHLRAVPDRR
jgi:hypothetical protein